MIGSLTSYATSAFPGHTMREIRAASSAGNFPFSTVAVFDDVATATAATRDLPGSSGLDLLDVAEMVPLEDRGVVGPDPEGPAGLEASKVGFSAAIGALIGAAGVGLVSLAVTSSTVAIVFAIVAGLLIGGVVGAFLGGLGRFGGERAVRQVSLPSTPYPCVVAVRTVDLASAELVAQRLVDGGAGESLVYLPDGSWKSPGIELPS